MRIYNNNNNHLLIAVLLLYLFNIGRIDTTDCVYSTADGELDLRALSYSNRPRFKDIPDTDTKILLKYSFNPCFSFNGKAPCTKAAACATSTVSQDSTLIARQDGRTFAYMQGLSTLTYTDGGNTKLIVFLLCDENSSIKATRDTDSQYFLYIEDRCACPGKCTYKPDDDGRSGLGGGAVFVIILLVVVAVYLIVGALFLAIARGERGINLIPNRVFWLQTVADAIGGVRYVLGKCLKSETYETVA